ncbi:hypothetical protein [Beijerinckia mobilis]|uniref:hypothetical protein n=1 Tax=Beijerinckia mobilis TaxID=231434 RepID=UPI001FDA6A9C|nr:hypothetical protein [Beijerinckia mobilis]
MHHLPALPKTGFLALAAGLMVFACAAVPAKAEDCNSDIANLNQRRQAVINQLNKLAAGNKKQLDPVASCPKLRSLVSVERELVAYLSKNKDWCSVPDEALENIKAMSAKSATVANQACTVAAQVKKAQSQAAAGGGGALNVPQVKLPTGPL